MGCDIHWHMEQRINGEWLYKDTFCVNRNYALFGFLADVRNGYGFARCDIGDPIEPLAPRRGVPKDASQEYKEIVQSWGVDGHSHTYMTLRELLEAPWGALLTRRGYG